MSVLENSYKERSNEEDDTRTDIAYGRACTGERIWRGTLGFSVLRFWLSFRSVFRFLCQKTLVFRFWCSLRFADFWFFSIRFSVFVENNSGFSVLLSNVVCIRFWPNFLAILDDFFFGFAVSNIPQCPPQYMELSATHFELSAPLSRSVAYQGMKCFAECKMAASFVSELKRQLIVHLLSTKKSRNCSNWWYKHETFTDC